VVPNLRRFLVDADKITATCSNMVQNVIVPAARGKQKYLHPLIRRLAAHYVHSGHLMLTRPSFISCKN
jgi:hypothetical protein